MNIQYNAVFLLITKAKKPGDNMIYIMTSLTYQ